VALIVRIDVDRPYGKRPVWRHALSRVGSDVYFPALECFGYLRELGSILGVLGEHGARAHVFFRRCTLPSAAISELIDKGKHRVGMHLEDSRSIQTFRQEKQLLERHFGHSVTIVSKHGSGGRRFGRHHHAPYEPEKYETWCAQSGVRYFLGNQEDPRSTPYRSSQGDVVMYPAAFWLEPSWRDTAAFPIGWLLEHARGNDVVLLLHPENVLASQTLTRDLRRVLGMLETRVLE
jgi:hypothetical protein